MSSISEDSFGWTTASSDTDIMISEDGSHSTPERKIEIKKEEKRGKKRKLKEEYLSDSKEELLKIKRLKKEKDDSNMSFEVKSEVHIDVVSPTVIKKENKNAVHSSPLISNDLTISDSHPEWNKKPKKKNKHSRNDGEHSNEISKIKNEDIRENLDSSEFQEYVYTEKVNDYVKKKKKHRRINEKANEISKIKNEDVKENLDSNEFKEYIYTEKVNDCVKKKKKHSRIDEQADQANEISNIKNEDIGERSDSNEFQEYVDTEKVNDYVKKKKKHSRIDKQPNEISYIKYEDIKENFDSSEFQEYVDTEKMNDYVKKKKKHSRIREEANEISNKKNDDIRDNLNSNEFSKLVDTDDTNNYYVKNESKKKKRKSKILLNDSIKPEQKNSDCEAFSPIRKKRKSMVLENGSCNQDNNQIDEHSHHTQEFNTNSTSIKEECSSISSEDGRKINKSECLSVASDDSRKTKETVTKKKKKCTSIVREESSTFSLQSEIMDLNNIKFEPSSSIESADNSESLTEATKDDKQVQSKTTNKQTFKNTNLHKAETVKSKSILQFWSKNNHLKVVKPKFSHEALLTENDEFWILKCPKEIHIQSFQEQNLILDEKCKLKINNQTYEGHLEDPKLNVGVISMDNQKVIMKTCVPKGIVQLRKRIPKSQFVYAAASNVDSNRIPLPETKWRHPLFGSDYKSYLELPSHVTEKMQNSHTPVESGDNVKRKKKAKKLKREIEEEMPVKKERKRKTSGNTDNSTDTKKRKPNKEEMWESEKAIEENLFSL